MKIFQKILILTITIIGIISLVKLISIEIDKDTCLDTSICKEGLEVNTEHGLIKINKDSCLKYGWIWDDENKNCNLKK